MATELLDHCVYGGPKNAEYNRNRNPFEPRDLFAINNQFKNINCNHNLPFFVPVVPFATAAISFAPIFVTPSFDGIGIATARCASTRRSGAG